MVACASRAAENECHGNEYWYGVADTTVSTRGAAVGDGRIRTAQSCEVDAAAAVRELHQSFAGLDASLVLFFCSSEYDLDTLAAELNRCFAGVQVVGCTTAGEIGPAGYREHSVAAAAFPADVCAAVAERIGDLHAFESRNGHARVQALLRRLDEIAPQSGPAERFAMLLIDGLSIREELVARAVQDALYTVPLIGGSAGDDMRYERTFVFHEGAFHSDSAVLVAVATELPFTIFKTQHFVATATRLVVTKADVERRVVSEINGLPAAQEYARLIGVELSELDPARFAAFPVIVLIDGAEYVRAIQKINPDGSLTFFCAIDEGLVLRVAQSRDLVGDLERARERIVAEVGEPQFMFACDCILRRLEIADSGEQARVGEIFRRSNGVGFSTYGEQFGGVHINQTLTGLAIGELRDG